MQLVTEHILITKQTKNKLEAIKATLSRKKGRKFSFDMVIQYLMRGE